MNVAPGATYEAVVDWGSTGATIGMRVIDNAGATTVARVTGFTEYPAGSGIYARAGNTAPSTEGQYSLVYDDDGGTAAAGHVAVEDLRVTSSAPGEPVTGDTYATTTELASILKLRVPLTAEQTASLTRVLTVATGEIDSELDRDDDLENWQLALVTEVCLERAVEHWQQMTTPWGIVGLGDTGAVYTSKDSWNRHALKLVPAKQTWGLA